jgi:hypothetical protein
MLIGDLDDFRDIGTLGPDHAMDIQRRARDVP